MAIKYALRTAWHMRAEDIFTLIAARSSDIELEVTRRPLCDNCAVIGAQNLLGGSEYLSSIGVVGLVCEESPIYCSASWVRHIGSAA